MARIEMTSELLARNIAGLEVAIAWVEKKKEETHSGIDKFMLDSFIIETREVLAVLNEAKLEQAKAVVFNYAPVPSPEG
jgi:hypothetical protein